MIEVAHDGEEWNGFGAEACALCRRPTRFWFTPNDVAVCRTCAATASPADVPDKRTWLNANRQPGQPRLPKSWKPAVEMKSQ